MKKFLPVLVFALMLLGHFSSAQVWSPQLAGHYGERIIYYNYGYYQGNVTNGVANGLGTFYYRDGSFFRGNFVNGWWHGEGMLVSPYYGYLTGCWSAGNYVGNCQNTYCTSNRVRQEIQYVQREKPNNNNYSNVSPEGYNIKRIEPETQMGKVMLGRYSGN